MKKSFQKKQPKIAFTASGGAIGLGAGIPRVKTILVTYGGFYLPGTTRHHVFVPLAGLLMVGDDERGHRLEFKKTRRRDRVVIVGRWMERKGAKSAR